MKKLLSCFLLICLFPSLVKAYNITSTTGTATQGSTISLLGDFPSKPNGANPLKFDNFENGTIGNTVTGWETGAGSGLQKYSNDYVRGVSTKVAKHDFVNQSTASLCLNEDYGENFSTIYLDWWEYVDPLGGNYSRNFKPWRLWTTNVLLQTYDQVYCENHSGSSVLEVYDSSNGDNIANYWHSPGPVYLQGRWVHRQVEFRESDISTANGRVYTYVDSIAGGSTAAITRVSSKHINEIRIGHYWALDSSEFCPASTGAYYYSDDVYVDTTLMRVEIGNNADYASATHREIQYPTYWQNNRIDITVNRGGFGATDTVYLFVVDGNGVPSVGHEITLGSEGTGPDPEPAPVTSDGMFGVSGNVYRVSN